MDSEDLIGVGILCVIALVIGVIWGDGRTEARWQKEVIEKGFAEYNQTTGEWQWKGDK